MLRRGLGGEQHPIDAFSANFVNSMLHLYRSEVATMVSYRCVRRGGSGRGFKGCDAINSVAFVVVVNAPQC